MPFELTQRTGLWLLGLTLPLVALYILRTRRKRLTVASTWLWREARRDILARHPFQKLRAQVPLLLELLALALLALALSRPAVRGAALATEHLGIVVDTSASMGARGPDGIRRLDLARLTAQRALQKLGPGGDALVIAAARVPRVVSPLDRDRRRLESAIERLEVQQEEGNLDSALALASDRLRQLPGRSRLVVITDASAENRAALARLGIAADIVEVGAPVDNTAITRMVVRAAESAENADPTRSRVEAFVKLVNLGKSPRDVFVTLRLRNTTEPLSSRQVHVAPGEEAPVVLSFDATDADSGAGLVAELSPGDAQPVDDRAYALVPPSGRLPVVVAPPEANAWVQRAILSDPKVDLETVAVTALSAGSVRDDALVVLDGVCPAAAFGGDWLVLNPPIGICRTATLGPLIERPTLTSWNERDSRMRFLTFEGVELLRAHRLETDGPEAVLLSSREAPLIADISLPDRTATLVGFDVGESNWPLKASFVLFVRNVLELARAHRAHGIVGSSKTGEAVRLRIPEGVETVTLEGPDQQRSELSARHGSAVIPEPRLAGFYFASWQGPKPGSALLAVNLTSSQESDLRTEPHGLTSRSGEASSKLPFDQAVTDYAWLAALLALGLVALDVAWLTRKHRPAPAQARPIWPSRQSARSESP